MSEQDSRTATVGKKRAFNNTPLYDLIAPSDSSDGEPAHKRVKQTSKATPKQRSQRASSPSRSLDAGEEKEYISLLDSSDSDAEDYASSEPDSDSEVEEADDAAASNALELSQGQRNADGALSGESSVYTNGQSLDDSADNGFVSSEAGSTKGDIPTVRGSADVIITAPIQNPKDEDMLAVLGGSSHDDEATHNSATASVYVVRYPGAKDRTAMAEGRRIKIRKLPYGVTADEVLALFKDYKIDSIYMPRHFRTKKTSDTAFVCLLSAADVQKAITSLNNKQIRGTKVQLNLSQGEIPAADGADIEALSDKTVKQSTLAENLPSQPTVIANGSGRKIETTTDGLNLGEPFSKQEAKLLKIYGDEYIHALRLAVAGHSAERPVYPIPLSSERRTFKSNRIKICHPEMLDNNVPIPLSELCFPTFIPLLLRANQDQAVLLLSKPQHVINAFVECVNIQYRSAFAKIRKEMGNNAKEYSHDAISAQVSNAMASSMPEVFENVAKAVKHKKDSAGYSESVKKAILDTLEQTEQQERDISNARLAITAKKEEKKQAFDLKTQAPPQEFAVVADKDLPKIAFDANPALEGSAELSSRYVSHMEGESNLVQDAAPEQDMDIQSEFHSSSDAEDDELQMRYFPSSEHSSGPRCIICGQHGHSTSSCGPVTCATCGSHELHHTWACPQNTRCQRCWEQGHTMRNCLEKLKRSSTEGMKCGICESLDHVETACSRMWRTYEAPTTARKVAGLLINCFSCGSNTHFGMDCELRSKYRAHASLTFSMDDAQKYIDPNSKFRSPSAGKDYTIKGKNNSKEFSIRGRAKQEPIRLDTDSDDGDFLRPPAKRIQSGNGHIQINRNANSDHFRNTLQSAPQTYQPQYSRERSPVYRDYREDGGRQYSGDYRGPPDQHHYHNGQHYSEHPAIDRYEGRFDSRFDASYDRDVGAPRGGSISRGENAPRGGNNASSGGKTSTKRKPAKRGSFRGRGK